MMNVAKQSQMAGGMNMGFVVIAEPDEVNAARIKTILDSLDKDFSYALVGSAEAAIQLCGAEYHRCVYRGYADAGD